MKEGEFEQFLQEAYNFVQRNKLTIRQKAELMGVIENGK